MKWVYGLIIWLIGMAGSISAQEVDSMNFRVYTHQGETFLDGSINEVVITAPMPTKRELRKGRKRLEKLTRLRWNIHKVYPYAQKVAYILQEVEDSLRRMESDNLRKEFIKNQETSLFGAYEDDIRKMSRSQGKVLVKLVSRETGISTYELIKGYKNGASALFWQSISLLFGINLKVDYNPQEEEMIEMVVRDLERGGFNIAYKRYDFSLP